MKKKVLILNNENAPGNLGYYVDETGTQYSVVLNIVKAVEELGYEARVMYHNDATLDAVATYGPDYIISSGRCSEWQYAGLMLDGTYHFTNLIKEFQVEKELWLNAKVPMLGICAGHQVCATSFGGKIACIDGGENVVDGVAFAECGFQKVSFLKDDPILKGIGSSGYFSLYHRDEVSEVPENFEILGSSEMCKTQIIKHVDRPVYGVQFHPEVYHEGYMDGRKLLMNFLSL